MVTPDNLDQVLAALKYADVKRARFFPDGGCELEFRDPEPELPVAESAAPQVVELPAPTAEQGAVVNGIPTRNPGYAKLFEAAPRFLPAE